MDLELLKQTIEQREVAALGFLNGDLAKARADSLAAYLSKPYGNEVDGRSQVVTSDVSDTIEGVVPALIRVFTSGDDIVEFEPFGPEDEESAKQETEITNYYLTQQNHFLPFLQTWLRDGLISKVGYAKVIWDESDRVEQETYHNLSDEELGFILQDQSLEVVEQEKGEFGWTVKLKTVNKKGFPKLYNCPPEEVLVDANHNEVSLRNAKFVQHRPKMTISELREMGYDVPDDVSEDTEANWGQEWQERARFQDEWHKEEDNDPASRLVTFKETYLRYDADGDGIAELRRVCMVGNIVLANEECDSIPLCAWTPVIMPHKHVGRSLAEMTEDIQLQKTTTLRQTFDNFYLSNNQRVAVSDKVNLDDALVSRPGGIVRIMDGGMPGEGHIVPITVPSIAGQSFPLLEYLDGMRETRTGITRYNQGLDANSLNKTATGVQAIMSAAQMRIELIARTFAEIGLRDLMLLMHELIRKHSDKEIVVKLRNNWVQVDPRSWKTRTDLRVSVGLGTGNREQLMQHILMVGQAQEKAFAAGIVTPENVFNLVSKLAETAGFKMPEMFFSRPPQGQPEQKPDPKMQVEQAKLQIEQQRLQIDQQNTQARLELEANTKQAEIELKRELGYAELEIKREIEMMKVQADIVNSHGAMA